MARASISARTVSGISDTRRRYRHKYRRLMLFETWGATRTEITEPVVGDELIPDATLVATRSIDCDARPAEVYPWLAQMGFGKAGWYSYDWLDNCLLYTSPSPRD